jgi:hypothetical protein
LPPVGSAGGAERGQTAVVGGETLQKEEHPPQHRQQERFPGLKVLLVEDNKVNQKVGKRMLSALDCSVTVPSWFFDDLNMVMLGLSHRCCIWIRWQTMERSVCG